uniref:Cation/H+ exchanger domain-containing protein n=1 Tax=Ditylenchus dipsaci TaxID=166011 RepID=A0A915DIP2_9BILA
MRTTILLGLFVLINLFGCPTLYGEAVTKQIEAPERFEIVSFNFKNVATPYTISLWLLFASIAKILFHVHKNVGYGLKQLNVSDELYYLNSHTFFLYLLPPIIFDAGYFMPNRQLFENFDSVLLFAIVGTIWNTVAIGITLLVLGEFNLFSVQFTAFEILLFAALISAVDPVAVIAVFEEIHVNDVNVFGEALFNDGVTVVLYTMFQKFIQIGEDKLIPLDYVAGGLSFFYKIYRQSQDIGTSFYFRHSIFILFDGRNVWDVFYLAIVACGISMKQYVKGNITHDASSSVKYFVKMLAQCSETVIFMFLGLSTISSNHHFDTAFLIVTVSICLIYRSIGVVVQCAVLNRFRNKKFTAVDQFVLSYGGLRGAIAFGLVVSMDDKIGAKNMFVTTCIAVIYFTVFLQGITIRPLLHWLKVEKQDLERQETMIENVYKRYCDYTMAGVEDIAGMKGRNSIRDTFERFNAKILKPILMKHEKKKVFDASAIVRAYTKITLQEAMQISAGFNNFPTKSNKVAPLSASMPASNYSTIHSKYEHSPDSRKQSLVEAVKRDRLPSLRADLDHYMSSRENTEALYTMFSQLLDRKISELQSGRTNLATATVGVDGTSMGKKRSAEDDIKDDYMAILKSSEPNHNLIGKP